MLLQHGAQFTQAFPETRLLLSLHSLMLAVFLQDSVLCLPVAGVGGGPEKRLFVEERKQEKEKKWVVEKAPRKLPQEL